MRLTLLIASLYSAPALADPLDFLCQTGSIADTSVYAQLSYHRSQKTELILTGQGGDEWVRCELNLKKLRYSPRSVTRAIMFDFDASRCEGELPEAASALVVRQDAFMKLEPITGGVMAYRPYLLISKYHQPSVCEIQVFDFDAIAGAAQRY